MSRFLSGRALVALVAAAALCGCPSAIDWDKPHAYPCVSGSADAGQCPGGWVCGLDGTCHDPQLALAYACDAGSDCAGGWVCGQEKVCHDPALAAPYACASDTHCTTGWRCGLEGVCHDADAGAPYLCSSDSNCDRGWRCGPSGRCLDSSQDALRPQIAAATVSRLSPQTPFDPTAPMATEALDQLDPDHSFSVFQAFDGGVRWLAQAAEVPRALDGGLPPLVTLAQAPGPSQPRAVAAVRSRVDLRPLTFIAAPSGLYQLDWGGASPALTQLSPAPYTHVRTLTAIPGVIAWGPGHYALYVAQDDSFREVTAGIGGSADALDFGSAYRDLDPTLYAVNANHQVFTAACDKFGCQSTDGGSAAPFAWTRFAISDSDCTAPATLIPTGLGTAPVNSSWPVIVSGVRPDGGGPIVGGYTTDEPALDCSTGGATANISFTGACEVCDLGSLVGVIGPGNVNGVAVTSQALCLDPDGGQHREFLSPGPGCRGTDLRRFGNPESPGGWFTADDHLDVITGSGNLVRYGSSGTTDAFFALLNPRAVGRTAGRELAYLAGLRDVGRSAISMVEPGYGLVPLPDDWSAGASQNVLGAAAGLESLYFGDFGTVVEARVGGAMVVGGLSPLPASSASPVVATAVPLADGGTEVIAGVDDVLYGGLCLASQVQLTARSRPLAFSSVLSIAPLPPPQAVDGGASILEAYALTANGLFQVDAVTESRWQVSEIAIPNGLSQQVWTDGLRGRVGYSDGTVLSLPSRVWLSAPLPEVPVKGYGQLCGQPYALTAQHLYRLDPPGGSAATGTWTVVPLAAGLDAWELLYPPHPLQLFQLGDELVVQLDDGASVRVTASCP